MLTAALAVVLSQTAPPVSTAEAEIERARVLIQDLYEEKALTVLGPWLEDETLPPALRARALVYAGIAQLDLANEPAARDSFRAALEADRGAVLPGWVSRRIRGVFDSELAALLAAAAQAAPLSPPAPTPAPAPAVVLPPAPVIIEVPRAPRPRQTWLGVVLGGGFAAAAGLAGLTYWKMRDSYARAENDPIAVETERLNGDTRAWYGMTWGLAVAAGLLLAGFVLWAVNPQSSDL